MGNLYKEIKKVDVNNSGSKQDAYVFLSNKINVYPCAYRGPAIADTTIYDPESRLTTEKSVRKIHGNDIKDYFIINGDEISCVIAGYNFSFTLTTEDIKTLKTKKHKYATIFIRNDQKISENPTEILGDITTDAKSDGEAQYDILDIRDSQTSDYYFIGLAFTQNKGTDSYYSLQILNDDGTFCEESQMPLKYNNISSEIDGVNITGSLIKGTGEQSIILTNNGNSADAKNAIALGEGTTADKENLVVVGKYNNTEDEDLFVVGNGTKTKKSNVLQVNKEKVIINKPTTINNTLTTSTDQQATFNGNVDANAGLDVTGTANITGELTQTNGQVTFNGNVDANNGLDVTGNNLTIGGPEICNIDTDGNITTASTLSVGDTATINGLLSANAGLNVTGPFTVVNNEKFTIDTNGNITNSGTINNVKIAGDNTNGLTASYNNTSLNIENNGSLKVTGKLQFNNIDDQAELITIGYKDSGITLNNNANINITANKQASFTTDIEFSSKTIDFTDDQSQSSISFSEGELHLPSDPNIEYDKNVVWVDKIHDGKISQEWQTISANIVGDSIVKRTSAGNIMCNSIIFGNDASGPNISITDNKIHFNKSIKLDSDQQIAIGNNIIINNEEAGEIKAVSFYATSDKRLKENIEPYKCEKSILDLPIYKYDFIDGAKNQIGCLAQDLQEICPEIVKENEDGYLSINENKLVYLLLQEVKELKEEIKELKGE